MLVGLSIGLTDLFAPLHELFHLDASLSQGIGAQIVSRNMTMVDRMTLRTLIAGYSGEQWMMIWLCPILVLIGRKWGWITGGFPLGYQMGNFFYARDSYDFGDGLALYVQKLHFPKGISTDYAYQVFSQYLLDWWDTFCSVAFLISLIVVLAGIFMHRKATNK